MKSPIKGIGKLWGALLFTAALTFGCGGGSDSGQLSLSLTDASTDQFQAVYVTISEIQVHRSGGDPEGGWQTVATPGATFNLLSLVNGVREELGIATLEAGQYTQMRLIVGDTPDNGINILSQSHPFANYVIDTDNVVHELKVPSGMQSGIKIVRGFEINANQTTELILDFDASASVVIAGNSGKYILKPTIKILETTDFSIVSGTVTNSDDGSLLAGALISAQIFNPAATDPKDEVVIQAATVADALGAYRLFLAPGTYNLVAYKEGFAPGAVKITTLAGETPTVDFALAPAAVGTVQGQTVISGANDETFVTLSFRKDVTINGGIEAVEMTSRNVANGGLYTVNLPEGDAEVVSSTFGLASQRAPVTVTAQSIVVLDIFF